MENISPKNINIRSARKDDCLAMSDLINSYAARDLMLPKTPGQLMISLANYFVAETEGKIIGTCGYKIWPDEGAEIISLAVHTDHQGAGVGSKLVEYIAEVVKEKGFNRLITLTVRPDLFRRLGFTEKNKEDFSAKFWIDCVNCQRYAKGECNETALLLEF